MKAFNLNFSEVLTKHEENPRDTAPLSLFKIYLKIVLKLQTEEKLETTTGFHVRLTGAFEPKDPRFDRLFLLFRCMY